MTERAMMVARALLQEAAMDHDTVYNAIREGVRDAILEIAGTTPIQDFYDAVQDGVTEAVKQMDPVKLPKPLE